MSRSYDHEPYSELMREYQRAQRGGYVLPGWVLDGFKYHAEHHHRPIPRAAAEALAAEAHLRGGAPTGPVEPLARLHGLRARLAALFAPSRLKEVRARYAPPAPARRAAEKVRWTDRDAAPPSFAAR